MGEEILFFLAVGTDHVVMGWNPASLVLFPLQFPLVFWFAKKGAWGRYNLIMAILAVVGFIWCLTESWTLVFPIDNDDVLRIYAKTSSEKTKLENSFKKD